MSKKINYISHLNGFMQRRVYDLLSPSATTLYLVIFDAFNKSCWNFEWLKLPTRELLYRTGLSSTHTLASSRKLLMDLGYIEFQLVKHGGKVYSAYKINPLDSSGMFIDKDNEHDEEINDNSVAEFNYNVVDNSVDNVVDNVIHSCSTATHPATESATHSASHPATESATHPATVYIYKKEKEKIKKVKKEDEDGGQLQALCDAYEDYRSKPISPKDRQKISAYLSEYGFDAMLEAMEIMVQKKAASIDYCGGILNNMHNDIQKQKEEAIAAGWQLA